MKLLLSEDEREGFRAVVAILTNNCYTVDFVCNRRNAIDYALTEEYDGILLDVMMLSRTVKIFRFRGVSPILMVTAKGE